MPFWVSWRLYNTMLSRTLQSTANCLLTANLHTKVCSVLNGQYLGGLVMTEIVLSPTKVTGQLWDC